MVVSEVLICERGGKVEEVGRGREKSGEREGEGRERELRVGKSINRMVVSKF